MQIENKEKNPMYNEGSDSSRTESVADAMTRSPATVTKSDTLHRVAELMVEHDCGAIPVVENDNVEGIITDRDIVTRLVAKKIDPATKHVSDVMTESVHTVNQDAKLNEAFRMMSEHQVRRLPVVDGNGKVVGMMAQADLALDSKKDQKLAKTVEQISQPEARA